MPKRRIIIDSGTFPIQPKDISAEDHLFEAFDNMETEISAGWIVRFCQERGRGWEPFTYDEINAFYSREHGDGFIFNRLVHPGQKVLNAAAVFAGDLPITESVGGGWVVEGDDGKYYVTNDFVARCYLSSPAEPATASK